jgi:transposase
MARRGVRVSDAQWAKIEPHLPRLPRHPRGGRPWVSHRAVIDGILWVLKTGARWRDLPNEYPSPATCWRRLKRWDEDGTWERIWRAFLAELDARGRLQWETAFIDGTFAAAKKGAPTSDLPGGGKAQSAWYWWSVRVFLWEYASPRPRRPRRASLTKRSRRG